MSNRRQALIERATANPGSKASVYEANGWCEFFEWTCC